MKIDCKHVWEQVSDYIDGSVTAEVREAIERHLAHCRYCSAVIDSTRNIVVLLGDERTFEVPINFSERLHRRLQESMDAMESDE
jgi:predicted anti-sigma-YlaC factor YlaD